MMLGCPPNIYWRVCWKFVSPAIIVALIVLNFMSESRFNLGGYVYPPAFQVLGYLTSTAPLSLMVLAFVVVYCLGGGCLVSTKPPFIYHT